MTTPRLRRMSPTARMIDVVVTLPQQLAAATSEVERADIRRTHRLTVRALVMLNLDDGNDEEIEIETTAP